MCLKLVSAADLFDYGHMLDDRVSRALCTTDSVFCFCHKNACVSDWPSEQETRQKGQANRCLTTRPN